MLRFCDVVRKIANASAAVIRRCPMSTPIAWLSGRRGHLRRADRPLPSPHPVVARVMLHFGEAKCLQHRGHVVPEPAPQAPL